MDLDRNILEMSAYVEQCKKQFRPENLDSLGHLYHFSLLHGHVHMGLQVKQNSFVTL